MLLFLQLGRRFGAALSLLLVLCTILTTVSVLQARQLGEPEPATRIVEDTVAPLRQAMRQLDQLRGLEALHLLVKSGADKRRLESDLMAQRRAIDTLLATCRPLPGDAADRQYEAAVRADFSAYWTVQEQLLAASRRTPADPAAATEAQQLLGGATQALFDRLRDHLDRWWTHRETRAREATSAQRAQAAQVLWGIALLGTLALGVGLTLASVRGRREVLAAAPVGATAAPASPPDALPAPPSRVQEVQALIDAVRLGSATVASSRAEAATTPD